MNVWTKTRTPNHLNIWDVDGTLYPLDENHMKAYKRATAKAAVDCGAMENGKPMSFKTRSGSR